MFLFFLKKSEIDFLKFVITLRFVCKSYLKKYPNSTKIPSSFTIGLTPNFISVLSISKEVRTEFNLLYIFKISYCFKFVKSREVLNNYTLISSKILFSSVYLSISSNIFSFISSEYKNNRSEYFSLNLIYL